ncbi:DUF3040 domain-containing protein [Arthrobacter sp. GCM10027362]|uniref:DUF3040 domain-containing protein n=1 Tax=Arthrobacter sp. GCM10027362 TaxID=3273379 RepID=UPI00363F92B3
MPLTHEERKQLEQLERELSREDPEFARKLRSGLVVVSFNRSPWNPVVLLAGVLVLLAGLAAQIIAIGVIGFLLMGAGAYRMSGKPKSPEGLR